jgi:hypothetical protein
MAAGRAQDPPPLLTDAVRLDGEGLAREDVARGQIVFYFVTLDFALIEFVRQGLRDVADARMRNERVDVRAKDGRISKRHSVDS